MDFLLDLFDCKFDIFFDENEILTPDFAELGGIYPLKEYIDYYIY